MNKPSIPKGTRDFSPNEVNQRNYLFDSISKVFKKYAFLPIETPSIEKLSTLTGKYGEEGEQLLFKILHRGAKFQKAYNKANSKTAANESFFSDEALRYDLTVPFARYVVQNQNNINIPFKRYQIQNVWRADRPQKGRYREFLQCDADVIGSKSIIQEIDFICLFDSVFTDLNLEGCKIKINSRKLIVAICEINDCLDKFGILTNQLDKLDKTDINFVKNNLRDNGFDK